MAVLVDPVYGPGLCECGCGGKTQIAASTEKRKGWVKGQPKRFINGHFGQLVTPWIVMPSGCWEWTGTKNKGGYGQLKAGNAHRAVWEARVGELSGDLDLDHLCRNRACVNPEHMEPVTHAENMRRGACARLTQAAADEIRTCGEPTAVLAARFGVSKQAIWHVRSGWTWSDGTHRRKAA